MKYVNIILIISLYIQYTNCTNNKGINKNINKNNNNNNNNAHVIRNFDTPIQLLRPDFTHQKLEIIEENLDSLNRITDSVAVISVVGPYHSGKSFLMNQIMGKRKGFGIGKYVDPETMGIWMWGEPLRINTKNGSTMSLIFIDTEGFSARNISEYYDAKIFAVATLLSSYLLYNSVKIINQDDLEYLELLARRTRLFALQSQIAKSKYYQDAFDSNLLQFPPLIWIVQDFVQQSKESESPKEWLLRLTESSSKEARDIGLTLAEIFPNLDCHTLFIPATNRKILSDLSYASEENLTEEFRQERDALRLKITSSIVPKKKHGKKITGAELSSLMKILVLAANNGSLPEIPGRWKIFLESMKVSSIMSCTRYYNAELQHLKDTMKGDPINVTLFYNWHIKTVQKSISLFNNLMLGYTNIVQNELEKFVNTLNETYLHQNEMNLRMITEKCINTKQKQIIEAEGMLKSIEMPLKTSSFEKILQSIKNECNNKYFKILSNFTDIKDVSLYSIELLNSISNVATSYNELNLGKIQSTYNSAIEAGIEEFSSVSKFKDTTPLTSQNIKQIYLKSQKAAIIVANNLAEPELDVHLYSKYKETLTQSLDKQKQILFQANIDLFNEKCRLLLAKLKQLASINTAADKISLPIFANELTSLMKLQSTKLINLFKDDMLPYKDIPEYETCFQQLNLDFEKLNIQRKNENMDAFTKEVDQPLQKGITIIKKSADKYPTVYEFTYFAKEICIEMLDDGKAKKWPSELKREVVDNFISKNEYLQREISSRSSIWSSIRGFLMWIYTSIYGAFGLIEYKN